MNKHGTGANSDPGKFANGFISHLSRILRFAPFPQGPTHAQQQDSLVFTGRRCFFYHWNSAFQRFFFQIMWFELASMPNFLFFSSSAAFVGHLGQVFHQSFSRACQNFQQHVTSVASKACQKFQTQKKDKESMKPKKKNTHARRTLSPNPPQTHPQCASLYMCGMLVSAITIKWEEYKIGVLLWGR